MVAIYFHSMESKKTGYPILKMPSFCVNRKKKKCFAVTWVWVNDDRFHFWVNYSFKGIVHPKMKFDIYLLTPRASKM